MFAMTSMGVNVINSINDGRGPYVFKISGQLCHRIGSLIPNDEARPEYCQLYIFDTDNEVRNRIAVATTSNSDFQPNEAIVASLITMLDTHNSVVQVFRTARDRLSMQPNNQSGEPDDRYAVKLFSTPIQHGNIYSDPVTSEVVGLVVNDLGTTEEGRDLIVQDHSCQLQRVKETHCKFMQCNIHCCFLTEKMASMRILSTEDVVAPTRSSERLSPWQNIIHTDCMIEPTISIPLCDPRD